MKRLDEVGSLAYLPNAVAGLVEVADSEQPMRGQDASECPVYQVFLEMATSSARPSARSYTVEI